jgi:hypothetical protein
MREQDLTQPLKVRDGCSVYVIYCLDDSKHYLTTFSSTGAPLKVLELHSRGEHNAVATVFSYACAKRYLVVFNFDDVELV